MADGYISQIKTPDNKVYLLKDSAKTDEKVAQSSNTEDKEFPIILKNTNNTTNETNGVKYDGEVTVNPNKSRITATTIQANSRLVASKAISQIITGTGTAGSYTNSTYYPAKWTFNTGLTATDGDIFTIKIPIAGHDYGVFMSIDNGSHYYPVVLNGTGRITTHYPVNTYLTVIFEPTGSAASVYAVAGQTSSTRITVTGGVWRVLNYYDSNSNDTGYYHRRIYPNLKAGSGSVDKYTIIMQLPNGRWSSIVQAPSWTTNSNGAVIPKDTGKSASTNGFMLGHVLLMYANATYADGANIATYNIWSAHTGLIDARYSFNLTSSAGFTAYTPVYIVGTVSDGLFHLDTTKWWAQTLPSSDDGKIYIYIGDAYDWYRLTFTEDKPMYWYKDGALRLYTEGRSIKSITRSGTTFTATRDDGSTFTFTQQDTNKYHKSGSWSGLTYTATAVNSADELKFTIPNKIQTNWELNATSGNSPALLFTRDSSLTDWKVFVTSGKLSFQSATDSSTWTERAYFKDNSGDFVATSFTGKGSALTDLNASNLSSGTVPVARLPLATTSTAGAVKIGSGISVSDGTISVTAGNLGLSSALRYQGTTTTVMSDGLTTAKVKINNTDFTPSAGDVVIYNDAEYLWTGSLWELIGAESSFKKVQTAVSSSSATGSSATTFVSSVTQDTQGVITVKTSTLNTSGTWSGTAGTANKLAASKTIWGQTFDGSANVTGNMTDVGNQIKLLSGQSEVQFLTSSGGAANGKFGKLGLNTTYANVDFTNYILDVNGKARIGALDGGQHVINGNVQLNSQSGSYNEGLRINRSTTGYANIYLGGTRSSTSGNQTGGWWIGTLSTPADATSNGDAITNTVFTISNNNTSDTFSIKGTRGATIGTNSGWAIKPRLAIGTSYNTSYTLYVNGTTYQNGNLNMGDMGTPSSYPATGNKITWSGGTDGAEIYYYIASADTGRLIFNTKDDANCLIGFAYAGAIKAYMANSTPSYYPATTNTGSIGTSDYKWENMYAITFNGNLSGDATSAGKWTTARTLTIGNTGKSVDGSGAVSWSLAEIGAAAVDHGTHVTTATVQSALGISSSGSGSKALTEKGTFVTFGTSNLTIGKTSSTAMAGDTTVTNVAISANVTTDVNYPIVFATSNKNTTAAKEEGLQKSGAKFYFNPHTGNVVSTLFNNLTLTAATTGFTIAGGTTSKTLTVAGTVTINTPTQWGIVYGGASGAYTSTAAGTSGQYLKSNGNAAPTWATFSASTVGLSNVTNDAQIPKSIGTTKGDIIYFDGNASPKRLAIGTNGEVLKIVSGIPSWETDNNDDTKNTAGSTNSNSKLYLIGAASQAANPQTYSDAHVFETNGAFSAKTLGVNADTDDDKVTLQWNSTDNSLDFVFA